ncbi:MAG: P-loop NTPase [Clostridia bacterium]|nr:P-loop NTPase [Clostridia bacterium]
MRKSNCYAVVSGKGGTGKTTVCAAVASALTMLDRSVCVIDLDVGLHNLDLALGMQDRALFDLGDVLAGRISLEDALLTRDDLPGLAMLAAPTDYEFLADTDRFADLVNALCEQFRYCLIDAPAGVGRGFSLATMCAGRAFVVSTPDTPCMSDSAAAAALLHEQGIEDARLVLNRVVKPLIRKKRAFNVDEAMDFVGLPLAGIVFEERAVTAAFNRCTPLMLSKAKAKREFTEIAKRVERIPVRPKF